MNDVLWLVAAGFLGGCEVVSRTLQRGWPTAAQVLRRAREHLAIRVVLVLVWVWLGWHVFAR